MLTVQVPRALKPLLKPARYKGAHGGRGGAKSHFFAQQLILTAYAKTIRAVCIREVQTQSRNRYGSSWLIRSMSLAWMPSSK